jgi:hypothetical protein
VAGQLWILTAEIDLGAEGADDLAIRVVLPQGIVNASYAGSLIASGGTPPYTYDDTPAGSFPPGLTIDPATGEITGTPSAVGYYEFTAAVTDSALSPATASKVVSILVVSGIAFTGSFAPGEVGIAYSSGLSASGGVAPYTWSIPSGSAPTGTTINAATGLVGGTPTTPGTYNLTVRATDSNGDPQDFPTSITIAAAVDLSSSSFPDGFVGVAYSAGPTTVGGVAPLTYTISSGAIPAGCLFSAASGFVSGVPTTVATYNFDVTVLDALGGTDTYSATVDITTGGGGGSGTVTSVDISTGTSGVAVSGNPIIGAGTINLALGTAANHPATDFDAAGAAAARQAVIQWKDEGVNQGAAGPATINVVGPTASVAVSAGVATLTITALPNATAVSLAGGTGEDGNATFDGTNTFTFATKTGNNYVLSRNVQLGTMKIATGCTLDFNGYKPFAQVWDCTVGFYGTAILSGGNGTSSVNTLGQPGGAARGGGGGYFGVGGGGTGGGNGGIGAASGVASAAGSNQTTSWGGAGAQGGRGGTSGANSSPNAGAPGTAIGYVPSGSMFAPVLTNTAAIFSGGSGGTGGSGGSSIAGGQAGGAGGAGAGGGCLDLSVGGILTDGSTPAGMLQAKGGNGGNGANGQVGNAGAGGGGAGGGGGGIRFIFGTLTGPSVAAFVDVSGGNGGNGGTALGTATDNAQGAPGGQSGRATVVNVSTGTWSFVSRVSGSAASGKTGGAGGISTITLA